MKILKRILIAVAVLLALPLLVALFVEKDYLVEREIVINKPKEEVFNYIKYLKNQDSYSKWASIDTEMKKTYNGTDGTVGFVSGWDSTNDEVGKGEQEITKITDGEKIDYELRFIDPFESVSPAWMVTEIVSDNQTNVKWGISGQMDYPMNLMLLFMNMEEMIGNDLQTGLSNLKTVLEK